MRVNFNSRSATAMLGTLVLATVTLSACPSTSDPDEDILNVGADWYGWVTSYEVGHTFTDGFATVEILPSVEGPLRLVSATPVMEGSENVEILGVRVRLLGCGLSHAGMRPFDVLDGFPPVDPIADGAVPLEEFEVPAPADTPSGEDCGRSSERLHFNLFIGHRVVADGTSWRTGTELTYEYEGQVREVFLPNRMTLCAPAETECEFVTPGVAES